MRRLVIDTATEACSVALFDDNRPIDHFHDVLGRGHAERLLPVIARLSGGGRADEIWVDCGPGSFTGVRIGLAAAKGLGLAWNVPVHGYSVFSLIDVGAAIHVPGWASEPRAVVMEGGHGEWFVQLIDAEGCGDVVSLKPDAAVALVADRPVAGSRANQLSALRGGGVSVMLLPDARWASLVPQSAIFDAAPIYGRSADAKKMSA